METPRNLIGPQLRKLRSQQRMSQQEMAALLQRRGWDISRGTLARIEGQVRRVGDFELLFLAEALKVPVDWLLSDAGARKASARMIRELQYHMD